MTDVISLLKKHRSIRRYKPDPVPEEHLGLILTAAQAASTSSNIQAYGVVIVENPERKRKLAELAGNQAYIEECSVFLVWLADLNKLEAAAGFHEPMELQQNTETLLLGTIDAALAAQNAAIAAESLGYGIAYIGGIRNSPREVSELLELPKHVYPVFGMCLGLPDQEPDLRPRLPLGAVAHREVYSRENVQSAIREYDETVTAYYAARAGGSKFEIAERAWSKQMQQRLGGPPARPHMHDFLESQGFRLK